MAMFSKEEQDQYRQQLSALVAPRRATSEPRLESGSSSEGEASTTEAVASEQSDPADNWW